MSQRKVLFVDDSVEFLALIREVMLHCSEGSWEVFTAEGAGPALALLQRQPVDLAVLDLEMPMMDGLQLLQLLQRRHPFLPRVVLTAHGTEVNRAACLSGGAQACLQKPTSGEAMQQLDATLNELARPQAEEGFHGVLRRVGLPDVIPMECLAGNSSVLEVTASSLRGEIYLRRGVIVHAAAGAQTGEEAFYQLLALRGGQFALRPFTEPERQTIDAPWEFLVMEAARKQDEALGQEEPAEHGEPARQEEPARLEAVPAAGSEPTAALGTPTRVEEVLLCSAAGEVLHEWHCARVEARMSLLEFISQKAWQMEKALPLGSFDRLEVQGAGFRILVRVHAERGLFVRTSPPADGAA